VSGDPDKPYQYKVDREMTNKFLRWKEVFAAMLVKRAMSTHGDVQECADVLGRSNEYRSSQDSILEFIRDKVRRTDDPGFKVTKSDLSSEFSTWHTATYGRGGPTARDLYDYFAKEFGRPKGSVWRNIRIIYGNDTESEDEDEDIAGDEEVAFLEEE
jgi:molybdopterin converting factor small subunit